MFETPLPFNDPISFMAFILIPGFLLFTSFKFYYPIISSEKKSDFKSVLYLDLSSHSVYELLLYISIIGVISYAAIAWAFFGNTDKYSIFYTYQIGTTSLISSVYIAITFIVIKLLMFVPMKNFVEKKLEPSVALCPICCGFRFNYANTKKKGYLPIPVSVIQLPLWLVAAALAILVAVATPVSFFVGFPHLPIVYLDRVSCNEATMQSNLTLSNTLQEKIGIYQVYRNDTGASVLIQARYPIIVDQNDSKELEIKIDKITNENISIVVDTNLGRIYLPYVCGSNRYIYTN